MLSVVATKMPGNGSYQIHNDKAYEGQSRVRSATELLDMDNGILQATGTAAIYLSNHIQIPHYKALIFWTITCPLYRSMYCIRVSNPFLVRGAGESRLETSSEVARRYQPQPELEVHLRSLQGSSSSITITSRSTQLTSRRY
jgi:hypothetical protein